jgi:hypothetical protein
VYKILLLSLIGVFLICCESDGGVHSYVEDISAQDGSVQEAIKKIDTPSKVLKWDAPDDWKESQENGIRLTSFIVEPQNNRGLCTVVILKGDGGGLQANVQRWMAQLNLLSGTRDNLSGFLSEQKKLKTEGGFPARFIDFTSLCESLESDSMIVSIITIPGQTIFVKMMEKKRFLIQKREEFLSFSQSFKFESRQD